jgi:hypothetical protein
MPTVSAPLRAARAAVFAAVCVALSAAGHAFMTAEPLPWWTFAAGFAGVFAVACAAAGRERSWAGIGVLLAAGQVALHTLFSFGMAASHTGAAMDGRASGLSVLDRLLCGARDSGGHIMLPSGWSARDVVASAGIDPDKAGALPAAPGGAHGGGHSVGPMIFDGGYGMLAAHAAAALVAAWWLRQGEAALFRLLARLSGAAVAPLRAVLAVLFGTVPAAGAPLPVRRPRAAVRRLLSAELRHAVVRRGPPAFAPAC